MNKKVANQQKTPTAPPPLVFFLFITFLPSGKRTVKETFTVRFLYFYAKNNVANK